MGDTLWHRRLRVVWESLERAAAHLAPGHPAESALLRALQAVEDDWRESRSPTCAEEQNFAARLPDRPT